MGSRENVISAFHYICCIFVTFLGPFFFFHKLLPGASADDVFADAVFDSYLHLPV